MLRLWLKQPHVAEYWQEPEDETEFRSKYLKALGERGVEPYIFSIDGVPAGYIQSYQACLVGGGWWEGEGAGVFGLDQYIGEVSFLGRGYGTQVITEFIRMLFSSPEVREVITDPDPLNARMIHVYEKIGFKKHGNITTPGGPAVLLRLRKSDFSDH